MTWFKHRHYWRPKTAVNTIPGIPGGAPIGGLIVEDCHCGVVRTIEFYPGEEPVVRIAKSAGDYEER
jgi:hypothetical protein